MDSYALSYLLKGIGDIPVGQAETAMLVLAIKHGYVLPDALLEVHRNNHNHLGSKQKYNSFNTQIAQEIEEDTFELQERFGLDTKEGISEGIFSDNPEDCIFWFSNGAYFDPELPQCMFITGDAYELWNRTEMWGETLKALESLWHESPDFVIAVGTVN